MKKSVKIIITAILLAFSLYYCSLLGASAGITLDEVTSEMSETPRTIPFDCTEDTQISVSIIPQYGYLKGIKVLLINVEDDDMGTFVCSLTDKNGNVLKKKEIELDDIHNGSWSDIILGTSVNAGKEYQLSFCTQNSISTPKMLFVNDAFDVSENSHTFVNDVETGKGLMIGYIYRKTLPIWQRIILIVMILVISCILFEKMWVPQLLKKQAALFCKNGDLQTITYWCLLGIFALIAVFLHCYRLMDVPYGLHEDEMAIGYDAWCISEFGTDRYGNTFPVYFANYGTGQNALYIYMSAILMKIFGYKELFMRVPSLVNAFLTAFFGFKIVNSKWKSCKANIIFLGLYTILPVFLQITRFGLESYLMLGFGTLFLYSLIFALEKQKVRYWIISGVCAGLVLYTYAISYIVMILFLVAILIYILSIKKISWKQFIGFVIPLGLIGMPLVLCQIINMFDWPEIKIGLVTITKFTSYRGSELIWNHPIETLWASLKCIFGNDALPYNSLPQFKTMYVLSIPFILVGFLHCMSESIQAIKEKTWNVSVVVMTWMLSMLCVACVIGGNGPNVNKLNGIFIACIFCLVDGVLVTIKGMENIHWLKGIVAGSLVGYLMLAMNFINFYFYEYNDTFYPQYNLMVFADSYLEVFDYINHNMSQDCLEKTFYIDEDMPIFFLGSTLTSPTEYDFHAYENHYQNYNFYLPDDIDSTANYIIKESNVPYAMQLEQNGFSIIKIDKWFLCYSENI